MCLTRRSSWTSWGILGCWRLWRSVVLGSPSAELLKTFSLGKYLNIWIYLFFFICVFLRMHLWIYFPLFSFWGIALFFSLCLSCRNLSSLVSLVLRPLSFLPARYKIIVKEKGPVAADDKKRSTDLLMKYDKTKKEWQLGKTKVTFSSFSNTSSRLQKSLMTDIAEVLNSTSNDS